MTEVQSESKSQLVSPSMVYTTFLYRELAWSSITKDKDFPKFHQTFYFLNTVPQLVII